VPASDASSWVLEVAPVNSWLIVILITALAAGAFWAAEHWGRR